MQTIIQMFLPYMMPNIQIFEELEMYFTLITITGISLQQNSYVRVAMNLNTAVFQPLEWLGKGAT